MNQAAMVALKQQLQAKLIKGCENAVEVIKGNTPIDTKRLWSTTRVELDEESGSTIKVRLVAGGLAVPGINRETNITRDVDYGIYVERRDGYIASTLPDIEDAIISELQ